MKFEDIYTPFGLGWIGSCWTCGLGCVGLIGRFGCNGISWVEMIIKFNETQSEVTHCDWNSNIFDLTVVLTSALEKLDW